MTKKVEDTIPGPIRYKFLQRAQRICDLAKVDYWEQPEVLSSLRERMETIYRGYDLAGDYKDDAESKTFEDLGSVEDEAQIRMDGWRGLWHRLLFSERYTVHRLVGPVVYGMFHSALRTSGSLSVGIYGSRFVLYGWNYYLGIIIIAVTVTVHRLTDFSETSKRIGNFIAMLTATLVFQIIAREWIISFQNWFSAVGVVDDVSRWINLTVGAVYLVGYLFEALAFVFVFIMVAAEILQVPAYHRMTIEAKRRRDVFKNGCWPVWIDNCFKFITGQTVGLVWIEKAR